MKARLLGQGAAVTKGRGMLITTHEEENGSLEGVRRRHLEGKGNIKEERPAPSETRSTKPTAGT